MHPRNWKICVIFALSSALHAAAARLPGGSNLISSAAGKQSSGIEYSYEAETDRVASLPGWGPLTEFNMFSGYITVDEAAGRALFYVLVESMRDPVADPLVLWLNGGPGCSSLGGGFMAELGPFYPTQDGKTLQANPHAWNRVASVVFLESPAYVGFSYSNTSSDRVVGDARTAKDSRAFLLGLIQRFPHLKQNDLYLSGESYAGHYVPTLAREIVRGNAAASGPAGVINLKGFLAGNPLTDVETDNVGAVDFWWAHALISDETATGLRDNCDFSKIGPLLSEQASLSGTRSKDQICDMFVDRASSELGPINIYEIYADICLPSPARSEARAFLAALSSAGSAGLAARVAAKRKAAGLLAQAEGADPGYDPCVDNEVETYLNLPEVQRALHANQTVILPWRWSDCTDQVQYSRRDLMTTMLPVYRELLESDLRILVFSGDVDGILPVVGTRRWVANLGLHTLDAWRPWFSETKQVGGYIVEYEGLTFATVRNAGHMVPYVQPERMFHLFNAFVHGEAV